jgi:hypothetical protein
MVRPSGEVLISTVSSGKTGRLPWRFEAVRNAAGSFCMQPVVSNRVLGQECDFKLGGELIVNIAVAGNDEILCVFGVAAPTISELRSRSVGQKADKAVTLSSIEGHADRQFFGYATAPQEAEDLLGYDSAGVQVYSGGSKIRSTRDGNE